MSDQTSDFGKIAYQGAMSAALGWHTMLRSGPAYPHDEVEAAFQDYAARANMNDWEHLCDMFG
jgi:hypothetical protein